MRIAITRGLAPSIVNCELTHLEREPINLEVGVEQHARYEACLEELGCEVRRLPIEPEMPDSVFVEDAAVVLDEMAVITRPGAESRRVETLSVSRALEAYREIQRIEKPGTLDGGDVLLIGRVLYVGASERSNRSGIEQLAEIVAIHGYQVRVAPVHGCLHLKSAVTQVGEGTLLMNPAFTSIECFEGLELLEVDPLEPLGANALLLGETVLYPAGYPRTRRRMEGKGLQVRTVDVSELRKAEGGVTCCALILEV